MGPLLPDAFWDDVPILHTPIPYADYQAQGSYGRILNLAEDVPPTTSVLVGHERQSNGALVPHLVSTDASGNLLFNPAAGTEKVEVLLSDGTPVDGAHPFPVTSGGGGGGPTPIAMRSVQGSGIATGNVGGPGDICAVVGLATAIYGCSGELHVNSNNNGQPFGGMRFYLADEAETHVIEVGRLSLSLQNAASFPSVVAWRGDALHFSVWFPWPIAYSSWPPGTDVRYKFNGDVTQATVGGAVIYV